MLNRNFLKRRARCVALCTVLVSAVLCFAEGAGSKDTVKPLRPNRDLERALRTITPASLRGDLSFLASDALAGRDTPSDGLDAAAEFIASRFRKLGLEAPVNGNYFQTADLTEYVRTIAERHHKTPKPGPVIGRNVIGVLRGSDPKLRDTYVVLSAHYDHVGTIDTVDGRTMEKPKHDGTDRIYNGANDDGSGTVGMLALAQAFSELRDKPKRSIVFLAFCGEELGLLGSRYYAEHPVLPFKQTVAEINLEQIGRTDGDIRPGRASITGFGFTSLGTLFVRAGKAFNIDVYRDKQGDKYFNASDNLNFARVGVPDTTICTAFEFPDYHGLKDEWPKIDYESMSSVSRMVGTVLWNLAQSETKPQWTPDIKETAKYQEAAAKLYGQPTTEPAKGQAP